MWPEEPPSPAPITCAPRRHQPHSLSSKPLETTNPFYLICCFGKIYINGVNNMWPLSVLFYLVSWSPDSPVTAWLSSSLLFFIMTQHFTPFSQLSNTPSGFLPLSERILDSFNGVLSTDDQDFVRTLFSPLLDLFTPSDFFVALPNCFSRWLPWFSCPASSRSLSSSHPHWCLWFPVATPVSMNQYLTMALSYIFLMIHNVENLLKCQLTICTYS